MSVLCTEREGLQARVGIDYFGHPFAVREYFRPGREGSGPDGYLVEQSPHSTVRPHFHVVDQFQVIVHGDGTLGGKFVRPVTAHYADAYTGYGPIIAGVSGLHYFTLRPSHDGGAQYLPESKSEQRHVPGGRRHRLASHTSQLDSNGMRAVTGVEWRRVFPEEPDGPLGFEVVAGPDSDIAVDTAAFGQYVLTLAGELVVDEVVAGPLSCLYFDPGEGPPVLRTDGRGAQLLVLRFPPPRGEAGA